MEPGLASVVPGKTVEDLARIAVQGLDDYLAEPDRIIIAIKRHNAENYKDQAHTEGCHQYAWVKGKGKVSIERARKAYIANSGIPNLRVLLKHDNTALPDNTRVAELVRPGDRCLVLSAETEDANVPSEAMQASYASPTNPHTAISESNPQSQTPSRQPLQPLNTQSSAGASHRAMAGDFKRESVDGDQSTRDVTPHAYETPPLNGQHSENTMATAPSAQLDFQSAKAEPFTPTRDAENVNPMSVQPKYEDGYMPHDPTSTPTAYQDKELEWSKRGQQLKSLTQETVPERLEVGVQAGLKVLKELSEPLKQLTDSGDATAWLAQIEEVRKLAVRNQTVVGVVGNTGAGKSSVINAILDEERLVPTNCMRACTAVVTELSYNHSNSEASRYRAEIQFIEPEEWRKELKILFDEVFDENGTITREISNPDSQAGIAYAKIRAVYHRHTKEMLANSTIDSLMRAKSVTDVLGTTRRINEKEPHDFYRRLQNYVDSKEKGTEKLDKNGNKITNPKREFEFWPLIKVVKIYTKADALSTGAVIVDLPGVHDSNAARAAVAENYMKQCTGLWILAPINRAVDDKAAKTLLGDTFKRQLKYDGTYNAVTFICSKTDDISRTEATDSLGIGEEMEELDEKLEQVSRQKRTLQKHLQEFEAQKKDHADVADQVDEQLETFEDLLERAKEGETVLPPKQEAKKRKRDCKRSSTSRKKRRSHSISSDSDANDQSSDPDFDDDSAADSNDEADDTDETDREPLTVDRIEAKLDEMRKLKKECRQNRQQIEQKVRDIRKQMAPLKAEEAAIDAKQSALCIAGRNAYSRDAIRNDFAAGIRELDQENAEEEDPEHFNPEEDLRDYDEVARNLPVFCVSSRAYQKLSGRLKKDKDVPGFEDVQQTEMPQLQAHCKKLTENGRQASCRRFLNSLTQLLTSMALWASDDNTIEDAEATLREQVFDKFAPAVDSAEANALSTADGWGAHRNDGGLHFMTYRATVRRSGVYQGAAGLRDFNQELIQPVYKQLASAWEKAFQRRLPHILQSFTKTGSAMLKKFHAAVADRCRQQGQSIARIGMLKTQLGAYDAIVKDMASNMIRQINDGQRDINREFTPVICQAMSPAYDVTAAESGPGCYMRMKNAMHHHVDDNRRVMFDNATKQVQKSIMRLCEKVREQMLNDADQVYLHMQNDYMSVIGGVRVDTNMSRQERTVRRDIDERITSADDIFQKVLDMNSEDLKAASSADSDPINGDAMEIDDDKSAENQRPDDNGEDADELQGDSRESSTVEAKHSSQTEGVKMEEDAEGGASQGAEVAE
ncbi:hypothetical protein D0869_07257 [Hortaea werneckii]|uniref:G domain-containing protein n=2 Tax=Hortaea werneckii TaxID=91943 RepID=A0A3M6YCG2_HORWE|nr:hypothetical protein KC324_g3440 [Hortaea werneckii]KAI7589992.1 hypothetical protein KC316_g3623 [Hortaea werneckii]RMX80838.1 hypothetical protein D0869_07257 [Hortaea werneckii]RMY00736.1 hypothetical protein D0868_08848 [Hortaea werneckii]